ncbi:efflux RND transporter periplasmic adaptor subunit [Anaeromyxobacter dehalogenans]|uniref:Secretion protein HlyD n=1 Tax=Anaeromyxobacter dehalogenans (strain 2CP-C) TaxID=290397 RepID=Q2IHW7_ANADE|nr:efflux RND transporter periplasmic adaptor subunit [Anaeromyxobacter dehalogenans]ABC81248.1 secretion protein HlyD [Anaeromyxobacter dehalogenans 2CP-C]
MTQSPRFLLTVPTLALAAVLGCSRGDAAALPGASAERPALAVRAERPRERLEGETARATGELRAKLQATVSAKVAGSILRVRAQVGDRVRKGDPIVELDPATIAIQLDQARAARKMALAVRDNARADLARTEQLARADAAAPAVLDKARAGAQQAEASLEQAEAQVRLLEQNLRDLVVRAPFDGVITARPRNVGDYLVTMPPTPVATVVAAEALEVRLAVPEGLVDPLKPGAVLRGRSIPGGAPFEAKVTSVGATVDPQTRAVEVLADVRAAAGASAGALRSGGLAEVDLGGSSAAQGPFVPAQAVVREGARRFVWVAEGGVARRREVQAEAVTPQWTRVRAGVAEGDAVVVEGVAGLTDGARVAVAQ